MLVFNFDRPIPDVELTRRIRAVVGLLALSGFCHYWWHLPELGRVLTYWAITTSLVTAYRLHRSSRAVRQGRHE